jgi:PAS domain S-box-containing protein
VIGPDWVGGHDVGSMDAVPSPRHLGVVAGLAGVAIAGVALVTLAAPGVAADHDARTAALAVSFGAAAAAMSIGGRSWPGGRELGGGFAILTVAALAAFVATNGAAPYVVDVVLLAALIPFALAARAEFRAHIGAGDLREVGSDVVLLAFAIAALAYLWMRPHDAEPAALAAAAAFAIFGGAILAMFGALTLLVPTTSHTLRFAGMAAVGAAALALGASWAAGDAAGAPRWAWWVCAIAPPARGVVSVVIDHDERESPPRGVAGLGRPALTSITIATSAVALSAVAIFHDAHGMGGIEATAILLLLAIGITSRILTNQRALRDALASAEAALVQQEGALRETDAALERVRQTNESLRRSEEHLRLVFDAAVDGFVEVDHTGTVLRANGAFGRMVGRDPAMLTGRPWDEVATGIDGADPAFTSLQHGGQATIARPDGQVVHLESTASVIPTDPPRTLMLVRDVSAAKVAEQTIRSLFHFLQDRDEDRTRLLRRSEAAIEQERNRIARDLHDGPVQGVSAATLSLEAALLMIKAGDAKTGVDVLEKIRSELAGEADALRRLMSGLRPPVLEERGLTPALREMVERFETDAGVVSIFEGNIRRTVPRDAETLAYRVVQEALTNVRRHASASSVTVHVDTDTGQLRVEVEDDGRGFETNQTRDYLRSGRVGLASMRERVELSNGTFTVRSSPGRGTAVTALIPLDAEIIAAPAM